MSTSWLPDCMLFFFVTWANLIVLKCYRINIWNCYHLSHSTEYRFWSTNPGSAFVISLCLSFLTSKIGIIESRRSLDGLPLHSLQKTYWWVNVSNAEFLVLVGPSFVCPHKHFQLLNWGSYYSSYTYLCQLYQLL